MNKIAIEVQPLQVFDDAKQAADVADALRLDGRGSRAAVLQGVGGLWVLAVYCLPDSGKADAAADDNTGGGDDGGSPYDFDRMARRLPARCVSFAAALGMAEHSNRRREALRTALQQTMRTVELEGAA